jgi:hypothetical protein
MMQPSGVRQDGPTAIPLSDSPVATSISDVETGDDRSITVGSSSTMRSDIGTATDEIRNLLGQYCIYWDDWRIEEWVALFSPDGQLCVNDTGYGTYSGQDALRAFIAQSSVRPVKHFTMNPVIECSENGHARSTSDFLLLGGEVMVTMAGRYYDQFVQLSGRWHFAERRIEFFGPGPSSRRAGH